MATRQHKTTAPASASASTRGRKAAAGAKSAATTKAAGDRTKDKTVPASRARKVTKVATPAQPARASARATARATAVVKKAAPADKPAKAASKAAKPAPAPARKQPAAKPAPVKREPAAKPAPAKKEPAVKPVAANKQAAAKAAPAKKQAASKAPAAGAKAAKKAAAVATAPAKAAESRPVPPPAAASPSGPGLLSRRAKPVERRTEGYTDERWLAHQRQALEAERATYLEQAQALRAEADLLVQEMEPGDIQFDDESGEGGTTTVDRERDLALSAQALQAVEEIDHALAKVANHTYGICENCGRLIPKPRLEALPFARLCINCKSGGLSRR